MAQPLYLPIVLLAAVVGTAVAFFAWVQDDRPGARPLTLFVVTASFWAITEGMAIASAGVGPLRFWMQVGLTLSAVIPIAWLATVLEYTGTARLLTRQRLAALLVWPAIFIFLVWTNDGHGLVWTAASRNFVGGYSVLALDFGLGFWAHQLYSYLLVTASAVLLLRMIFRTNRLYRSQSTALLVAIAVPMVGNALYIFEVFPAGLDPTGVGYVLTGVVIAGAMFHTQLLQISPAVRELGREELLSELDDAVFILDENERVVDGNLAAEQLLAVEGTDYLGTPLAELLPGVSDSLDGMDSPLRIDRNGRIYYFDVQVSRLSRGYGALSGALVSLRDVTDQRRREQRLDVLNRVLRHNIRNELNVVRGNVELAHEETSGDAADRLQRAMDTIDTIVERSDKVGRLSRLFETDKQGTIDLAKRLETDLERTIRDHPAAEVTLSLPDSLPVVAGPSITVVFEELLTNAIVHNDGDPHVEISVDDNASDETFVVVTVADDGPGIDEQERRVIEAGRETPLEHSSGVGLWLANWVVERHGGELCFENRDDGCVVSVRLYRPEDWTPEKTGEAVTAGLTD